MANLALHEALGCTSKSRSQQYFYLVAMRNTVYKTRSNQIHQGAVYVALDDSLLRFKDIATGQIVEAEYTSEQKKISLEQHPLSRNRDRSVGVGSTFSHTSPHHPFQCAGTYSNRVSVEYLRWRMRGS